jgi:hypothetical protein
MPDRRPLPTLKSEPNVLAQSSQMPTPISLALIQTFLRVAIHEGKTVKDIAGLVGMSASTVGKLLMDLSSRNRAGGVGLSLIEQRVDDFDQRYP